MDVNPRNGLRKGFPIKISGYAVGGGPRGSFDNGTAEEGISSRFRSRRNSESSLGEHQRVSGLTGSTRGRTPDPEPHTPDSGERNGGVKQLYSPLLGLRKQSRDGFRRRSIGGFSSKPHCDPQLPRVHFVNMGSSRNVIRPSNEAVQAFDHGHKILQQQNNVQSAEMLSSSRQTFSNMQENKLEKNVTNETNSLTPKNEECQVRQLELNIANDGEMQTKEMSHSATQRQESVIRNESKGCDIEVALSRMSEELKLFQIVTAESSQEQCSMKLEEELIEDQGNSLDDVITKMKNSLKAIKDGMNTKALIDINREFTPLELPPLSPLPLRELTPADLPALSPIPPYIISGGSCPKIIQDANNYIREQNIVNNFHKNQVISKQIQQNVIHGSQPTNKQLLSESDTDKCDTDVAAAAPTDAGDSGQGQFDNEEVESHVSVTLYLQQQETGPRVDSVDSDNVDSDSDATDVDTDVDTEEDIADSEDNEDISTTSSSSSSSSSSTQTLTTIREHDNIKDGFESDSTLYPDTDCEDIYGGRVSSAFGGCHGEEEDGHLDYVTRTIGDIENNNKQHPHKYCWQCHQSGHDQRECGEVTVTSRITPDCQVCPRCLQTDHWEDECWVLSTPGQLCSVCSVPGHAAIVHSTQDYALRKVVVDTFGWLSFKLWFLEAGFRLWWSQSGFTGVPLHKILGRSNSHEIKLKVE